jgi:hypothetical protein
MLKLFLETHPRTCSEKNNCPIFTHVYVQYISKVHTYNDIELIQPNSVRICSRLNKFGLNCTITLFCRRLKLHVILLYY